jgi:hypothetical protein
MNQVVFHTVNRKITENKHEFVDFSDFLISQTSITSPPSNVPPEEASELLKCMTGVLGLPIGAAYTLFGVFLTSFGIVISGFSNDPSQIGSQGGASLGAGSAFITAGSMITTGATGLTVYSASLAYENCRLNPITQPSQPAPP